MSDLDVCFAEAFAHTASMTPGGYPTFQRHLDPSWIEEALATTGTATLRKRRLPAERVVWLLGSSPDYGDTSEMEQAA